MTHVSAGEVFQMKDGWQRDRTYTYWLHGRMRAEVVKHWDDHWWGFVDGCTGLEIARADCGSFRAARAWCEKRLAEKASE